MKRLKVVLHLAMGDSEMEQVTVEAFCHECIFWEQDSHVSQENYGDCHRHPKMRRKHRDDWCGEYKPDV